jgi:hypothetical protein
MNNEGWGKNINNKRRCYNNYLDFSYTKKQVYQLTYNKSERSQKSWRQYQHHFGMGFKKVVGDIGSSNAIQICLFVNQKDWKEVKHKD